MFQDLACNAYVSGLFASIASLEKGGPVCCFSQYIKYKSGSKPMHSSRNGAYKGTTAPGFPLLCLSKPPAGATRPFLRHRGISCGQRNRRNTEAQALTSTESGGAPAPTPNLGSQTQCWDSFLPHFLQQKPALSTSVHVVLRAPKHLPSSPLVPLGAGISLT